MKNKAIAAGATAAVVAICAPLVMLSEGLRLTDYADPVGISTACYGHTGTAKIGIKRSVAECESLLRADLQEAIDGVNACISYPLKDYEAAALVSFTYNVGRANLCKSTLARKANAGDKAGMCAELSKWVYAKGFKLRGLVKRRAAERKMCEGSAND